SSARPASGSSSTSPGSQSRHGARITCRRRSHRGRPAARRPRAAAPPPALAPRRALDSAGAAFVNGTAAHGEDFDDTFEGGPVHAGVVIVPALLAAAERYGIAGPDLLRGIVVGCEV